MTDPIKARVHEGILPKLVEGLSPEVDLVETAQGVEMTVTTKSGSKTALIPKGQDYWLTDADKAEIEQEAFDTFQEAAEAEVEKAEGWAEGTQDGTPVESGSPYYEHNAKYWAEEAADSADDAADSATAAQEAASTASAAYGTDLLAPDFSTTSTYAVGDYVIHSGDLYRCTTAVTTAGEWNNSSWTQVAVGGEVGALKSAINVLEPTASASDVGKYLKAKTVSNGKVTEYEFGAASGGGLTADIKTALLACFANVAWIGNDGQDYYDALESALNPPAGLSSISAVYTQSGTVYTTDTLNSLKPDLVVTAYYEDGTTETVTTYTLSGTLTVGTSTITVTFGGKTTTFTVMVSINTTVQIEYEDKMLAYYQGMVQARDKTNAGVTIVYNMDSATTILYPAGVIPTNGDVFSSSYGVLQVLNDGNPVNYVDENNRWAKAYDSSHTYTEFKNSWNVSSYNQIRFTVDKRCIDDAYMYDYTTGQIWFAGINTPYYGMSNISEATT